MSNYLRQIRVYRCPTCQRIIHDHGAPGSKFMERVVCPKCQKPMPYTTELYRVTVPDPKHPRRRVAVRISA
jgi:hypothetical protein